MFPKSTREFVFQRPRQVDFKHVVEPQIVSQRVRGIVREGEVLKVHGFALQALEHHGGDGLPAEATQRHHSATGRVWSRRGHARVLAVQNRCRARGSKALLATLQGFFVVGTHADPHARSPDWVVLDLLEIQHRVGVRVRPGNDTAATWLLRELSALHGRARGVASFRRRQSRPRW